MFACPEGPGHNEFIVYPSIPDEVYNLDGLGLVVDREGKLTNRFSDGVIGVPEKLRSFAEEEMQAECAMCGTLIEWSHDGY